MSNKDLDSLFEKARQSFKADMPLDEVKQMINKLPQKTSFWNGKTIGMVAGTAITLALGSMLFFNSNSQTTITQSHKEVTPSFSELGNDPIDDPNKKDLTETTRSLNKLFLPVQPADKDEVDEPIDPSMSPYADLGTEIVEPEDSLIPEEIAKEYTVSIEKSNSERQINQLQNELKKYGIDMVIQEILYNGKREIISLKGKFSSDSLFCGSALNNYHFNFGKDFEQVSFTFKINKKEKLKYLKIESEQMDDIIECYDDEAITDADQARKLEEQARREMEMAQEELRRAQIEMEMAQKEMRMAHKEMRMAELELQKAHKEMRINKELIENQINLELKKELDGALHSIEREMKVLRELKEEDWTKRGMNPEEAERMREEMREARKSIREAMKEMKFEEIRIEIDESVRELKEEIEEEKLRIKEEIEREIENGTTMEPVRECEDCDDHDHDCENCDHKDHQPTKEELKEEAKELKEEAKRLRKEARQKAREARKKQ